MSIVTRILPKPGRSLLILACAGLAALTLGSCDAVQNQLKPDRAGNMEIQDYRDALAPRQPKADAKSDAGIPELQSYVAPPNENAKAMPLVSISINQTVPLRDALFELAKQANYDAEIDPRISGSIIFTARDRPLDEVVARIADIAGLRSSFENNTLHVALDTAYLKSYKIDYLSYVRKSSSSIQNNVSLASSGGQTGGTGAAGSQFQAASENEANFWGELQTNLTQLIGAPSDAGFMKTSADPQISVAPSNPAPVAAVSAPGPNGKVAPAAPPQTTLQVSSLPAATAGSAPAPRQASAAISRLNKQAGIVSVYANDHQQNRSKPI